MVRRSPRALGALCAGCLAWLVPCFALAQSLPASAPASYPTPAAQQAPSLAPLREPDSSTQEAEPPATKPPTQAGRQPHTPPHAPVFSDQATKLQAANPSRAPFRALDFSDKEGPSRASSQPASPSASQASSQPVPALGPVPLRGPWWLRAAVPPLRLPANPSPWPLVADSAASLPASVPSSQPATAPAWDAPFVLERQPRLSVILSIPCTGCGHWYAQNPQRGARFLGASLALLGTSAAFSSFDDQQASEVGALLFRGWQNLKFYGAFDAYREARALRPSRRGEIALSQESLADLARAPFRAGVVRSPWVWAGVPASLALGFTATALFPSLFAEGNTAGALGPSTRASEVLLTGSALPVAIGEEAFFRGVVQTALEERFGARRGWLAGSALFGAAHLANFVSRDPETQRLSVDPVAAVALPVITTAGALMGKAYQDTGHQLATSVAIHFWYDFTLFAIGLLSPEDGAPAVLRFGAPF